MDTQQRKRCPKGTRKNKKTGDCEPIKESTRCPKGTRKNKKTGKCESKILLPYSFTLSVFFLVEPQGSNKRFSDASPKLKNEIRNYLESDFIALFLEYTNQVFKSKVTETSIKTKSTHEGIRLTIKINCGPNESYVKDDIVPEIVHKMRVIHDVFLRDITAKFIDKKKGTEFKIVGIHLETPTTTSELIHKPARKTVRKISSENSRSSVSNHATIVPWSGTSASSSASLSSHNPTVDVLTPTTISRHSR